jgi:CheY-like chemotaxis protein
VGLVPNSPTYRVLIADDQANNRQVLVNLLKPLGFHLREASNGQETLALWEEWHPHLIWLDIRMPIMNGYEAVQHIKAHPNGHETTVIALTASAFDTDREAILAAGCDDFLGKPFLEEDIFTMLSKHLGICYQYADAAANKAESPKQSYDLTPEMLRHLSADYLANLHYAATLGDINQLDAIIEQIRSTDDKLAETLDHLVSEFEFEKIIAAIQATQNHNEE